MIELQTVWGWQPALYLFLGGLGAGAFVVAALLRQITRGHKKVVAIAMWSAIIFLVVGLGCLLMEVSAPVRAAMLWQSFSNLGSSWMAIGAWLLFAGVVVCGVAAVANTEPLIAILRKRVSLSEGAVAKAGSICSVLGALLAFGVAVYTGVLLMSAPGVPLWNTVWLPALFTVSAMDTGVAFVALLICVFEPAAHGVSKKLETATVCLIVLEAIALVGFLGYALSGGDPLFDTMAPGYAATAAVSAEAWLTGQLALPFWLLLVAIGLVLPLACALAQVLGNPRCGRALGFVGAAGVLVGGCTLRFITLLAGAHVDIVANAVSMFLM